jgi:hypothetical protein
VFSIVVVFALILGLLAGVAAISQYNSCQQYDKMDITVQYEFWTGCMANHPKFGWLPIGEYFKVINLNIPQQ